jgi:hypothetical protein
MSDFGISVICGVVALLLFVFNIVVRSYAKRNPTPNPLPESIRRRVEPTWFLYSDFLPIILFLLLAVDRPPWISTIMVSLWVCYIAISTDLPFRNNKIRNTLSGELTAAQTDDIRFDVKRRFVMAGLYFFIGFCLIFSRLYPNTRTARSS